jgi:hypothetical protein
MRTRFAPQSEFAFARRQTLKERRVTAASLSVAKAYALRILKEQKQWLQRRFVAFARRKYRCKPSQVSFLHELSEHRVANATLKDLDPLTCGETDGVHIWVSSCEPMTFDDLINVLVHESLHDYCYVRGRCMSCANEHKCMRGMGEVYC